MIECIASGDFYVFLLGQVEILLYTFIFFAVMPNSSFIQLFGVLIFEYILKLISSKKSICVQLLERITLVN